MFAVRNKGPFFLLDAQVCLLFISPLLYIEFFKQEIQIHLISVFSHLTHHMERRLSDKRPF